MKALLILTTLLFSFTSFSYYQATKNDEVVKEFCNKNNPEDSCYLPFKTDYCMWKCDKIVDAKTGKTKDQMAKEKTHAYMHEFLAKGVEGKLNGSDEKIYKKYIEKNPLYLGSLAKGKKGELSWDSKDIIQETDRLKKRADDLAKKTEEFNDKIFNEAPAPFVKKDFLGEEEEERKKRLKIIRENTEKNEKEARELRQQADAMIKVLGELSEKTNDEFKKHEDGVKNRILSHMKKNPIIMEKTKKKNYKTLEELLDENPEMILDNPVIKSELRKAAAEFSSIEKELKDIKNSMGSDKKRLSLLMQNIKNEKYVGEIAAALADFDKTYMGAYVRDMNLKVLEAVNGKIDSSRSDLCDMINKNTCDKSNSTNRAINNSSMNVEKVIDSLQKRLGGPSSVKK